MTTHERAVEVAASQDTVFHLLSDPRNLPEFFGMITNVFAHGPDSVTLTAVDRNGRTHASVLRCFADGDEMHVDWELDHPRTRGEVSVTPGPDLEGWNHCIVRAVVDDGPWVDLPAEAGVHRGYHHAPGQFGGTPGHEGLALGPATPDPDAPTTVVDPERGTALVPGETLERALALLRDHLADVAHRT
ncbi:SRPBCC family protein [Yinghuangia sp. YIM S10712]|uniref:SRPBCC family protein n=1 Tax=Yinghuangia sp. YIM S10712 TaxID=3436930 RepID=UPI003F53D03E